jgi:hypothetical protein
MGLTNACSRHRSAVWYRGENWLCDVLRVEAHFGKVAARLTLVVSPLAARVFQSVEKAEVMIWNRPNVEQYRRYRSAGKRLNQKIIDAFMTKEILETAADALRVRKKNQLILDSESELDVVMDFALYEVLTNGINLVTRYANEVGASSRAERDLLAAMGAAHTGLFRVTAIRSTVCQLELKDMVDSKRQLTLTDINLSQSAETGLFFFLRPLELKELAMTSGIGFPFPLTMEKDLVQAWKKADMAQRFVKCYQLSKRSGVLMDYSQV